MRVGSLPLTGLFSLSLGAALRAEVLVVDQGGAGDFREIQAAVDASGPGDLILVRPGTYASFDVAHRSLTLFADGPRPVVVGGVLVQNTLQQHEVILRGLELRGVKVWDGAAQSLFERPPLRLSLARGPVRVEDCVLEGASGISCCFPAPDSMHYGGEGLRSSDALDLVLARCVIRGGPGVNDGYGGGGKPGGEGVLAARSRISIHDSEVRGGNGNDVTGCLDCTDSGGHGGHGILSQGSAGFTATLHLSGTSARGGAGGGGGGQHCFEPGGDGGDGVRLLGPNSEAWITDGTLLGGPAGCGPPGEQSPGQPLRLQSGASWQEWAGTARRFQVGSPAREGELVVHRVQGRPGDRVWLVETALSGRLPFPFLGILHLDPRSYVLPSALGTIPAGGTLIVSLPAARVPVGQGGFSRRLQAVFQEAGGGPTWWGAPSFQAALDPSH